MSELNREIGKVTETNYLDAQFIHTYLKNKFSKDDNVLVFATTTPLHFSAQYYFDSWEHMGADDFEAAELAREITTDIVIPFHMEPSKHFTLLHVKLLGNEKKPVITWLDSMGGEMPESVEKIINDVFQQEDKEINKRGIKSQQKNGYDCGVYVGKNAETMVKHNPLTNEYPTFKTMSKVESVTRRKAMVMVVNTDTDREYKFVESKNNAHSDTSSKKIAEKKADTKNEDIKFNDFRDFVNDLSDNLVANANAEDFEAQFDAAVEQYKQAYVKVSSNRFSFFKGREYLQPCGLEAIKDAEHVEIEKTSTAPLVDAK